MEYATSQLPQITILPADATYLLWIYCKEIPMNSKKSARLAAALGAYGRQLVRVNYDMNDYLTDRTAS